MPKLVTAVRAAPEHRDILERVTTLLKAGHAAELRRLLAEIGEAPVGTFSSAQSAIEDAVFRLVAQLDPDGIWLFGSRARGDHRPDSDIDLLVVLPDGLGPNAYTLAAANRPLLGGGAPVEVFPVRRSAFDADLEALGGLAATAKSEGRRLYQAWRLARVEPAAA
jgi:nucleotidyltransferase-like protein